MLLLGHWLKEKRIPFAAFGERIGVSHVSVSRYVRGERIPRRHVMERIVAETNGEVPAESFYTPCPDMAGEEAHDEKMSGGTRDPGGARAPPSREVIHRPSTSREKSAGEAAE